MLFDEFLSVAFEEWCLLPTKEEERKERRQKRGENLKTLVGEEAAFIQAVLKLIPKRD